MKPRPQFVPASLQRVRCYLRATGDMRVKPWAGVEETLDAFHDLLVARRGDEAFWAGLGQLLGALSADMKKRTETRGGGVIDNEVLDPERRRELLDEIRRKLDEKREGKGRFGILAASIPSAAVGLFCLLGGVATVGCYSSSDLGGDGEATEVRHDPDAAADPPADPAVDRADLQPDPPLPDVPPDPVFDSPVDLPADPVCDPSGRTLEQILTGCDVTGEQLRYYLDCIDALHASWRTGLTKLFDCENCENILFQLQNCLDWRCWEPNGEEPFDVENFLDNCAVYIYLGVRFE
jgi:hypothetical protein